MSSTENDLLKAKVEVLTAKLESQKKDKLLHLVGGLVFGLVVGFLVTNWLNASAGTAALPGGQAAAPATGAMPPDHPPVEGGDPGAGAQAAMPEVQEKLKKAEDNPQDYEAQLEAWMMFYRIKNYDKALTYAQRAYQLKPDDFDSVVILANTQFDVGSYAEAKPLYEKAVGMKPDEIDVRTDLGTTYFRLGDTNKALATFRESLKLNPKHEQTLHNMAFVAIQTGDYATAEDSLNKLAQVNPQNQNLAMLRQELDQAKASGKIPTH